MWSGRQNNGNHSIEQQKEVFFFNEDSLMRQYKAYQYLYDRDPRRRRKRKSVQKYIWWNYETKILLKLKKETDFQVQTLHIIVCNIFLVSDLYSHRDYTMFPILW